VIGFRGIDLESLELYGITGIFMESSGISFGISWNRGITREISWNQGITRNQQGDSESRRSDS